MTTDATSAPPAAVSRPENPPDTSQDDKEEEEDNVAAATDDKEENDEAHAAADKESGKSSKATAKDEAKDTPVAVAVSPEDAQKQSQDDEEETGKAAADETDETSAKNDKEENQSPSLPTRPIKRARTAYFIFADDKRAEVTAQHPGEGVGSVARAMGQLWSLLDEEEKAAYQQRAAEERARVAKELEKYKDAPVNVNAPTTCATSLTLPVARIRKIVKLDPEVKGLSKEALLLVTKCAELATSKLGLESVKVAALQNRRKLLPDDVAHVCATREQYLFLREDLRDLQRDQVTTKQQNGKTNTATATAERSGKPLTEFFKSAN